MDLLLLFIAAIGFLLVKSSKKLPTLGLMVLGLLPLEIWALFSLLYYGTPIPNTALAKLTTGIDAPALLTQGGYYFLNSLRLEPTTLLIISAVMVHGLMHRDDSLRMLAIGMLLYLAYTAWIGGDFMSGRYFTAPLAVAAALLSGVRSKRPGVWTAATALGAMLGIVPIYLMPQRSPTLRPGNERLTVFIDEHGISDERRFYFDQMGFLDSLSQGAPAGYASSAWLYHPQQTAHLEVVGTLGVSG